MNNLPHSDTSSLKRRFFATYYDTPARVVYGGEDLHIEADGWYPGLLEGDLEGYYLLLRDRCSISEIEEIYQKMLHMPYYGQDPDKDIARSLGMVCSFMGYSTQQLIDLGWIKICG